MRWWVYEGGLESQARWGWGWGRGGGWGMGGQHLGLPDLFSSSLTPRISELPPVTGSSMGSPNSRGAKVLVKGLQCPPKSEPLPCLGVQSHNQHRHLDACTGVCHEGSSCEVLLGCRTGRGWLEGSR